MQITNDAHSASRLKQMCSVTYMGALYIAAVMYPWACPSLFRQSTNVSQFGTEKLENIRKHTLSALCVAEILLYSSTAACVSFISDVGLMTCGASLTHRQKERHNADEIQ